MRGAPAKAIQELAGHENLTTTMRYMHLSEAAPREGIRALERGTTRAPEAVVSAKDSENK